MLKSDRFYLGVGMEKLVKITAIGLVIPTLLVLMWALIQWGNAGK